MRWSLLESHLACWFFLWTKLSCCSQLRSGTKIDTKWSQSIVLISPHPHLRLCGSLKMRNITHCRLMVPCRALYMWGQDWEGESLSSSNSRKEHEVQMTFSGCAVFEQHLATPGRFQSLWVKTYSFKKGTPHESVNTKRCITMHMSWPSWRWNCFRRILKMFTRVQHTVRLPILEKYQEMSEIFLSVDLVA